MRKIFLLAGIVVFVSSCAKEEPVNPQPAHPIMKYTNLQEATVDHLHPRSVDIDKDGINDFSFGVLLVGDPVLERDRLQFLAHSKPNTNLLNNNEDQSPVLNRLDIISKTHSGYEWFEISAIVLAEKITTMAESFWEGLWKNATHKYLPVQVKKNNKFYNGWIELSFDANTEQLILHRAAISTEENRDAKAGY